MTRVATSRLKVRSKRRQIADAVWMVWAALDGLTGPRVGIRHLPFGADLSQTLVTYTAEPGSRSQDALNLPASRSAPPTAISSALDGRRP